MNKRLLLPLSIVLLSILACEAMENGSILPTGSSSSVPSTPGPQVTYSPMNPAQPGGAYYTTQLLPLNLPAPADTTNSYPRDNLSKGLGDDESSSESDDEETHSYYGPHNRQPIEQVIAPYVNKETDDDFDNTIGFLHQRPKWSQAHIFFMLTGCLIVGSVTICTLLNLYKKNAQLINQNVQLMMQLADVKNQVAGMVVEKQGFVNQVALLKDELITQSAMYEQIIEITEEEVERFLVQNQYEKFFYFNFNGNKCSFKEHISSIQVGKWLGSTHLLNEYRVIRPFLIKKIKVFEHVNNTYYKFVLDWITQNDAKLSSVSQ